MMNKENTQDEAWLSCPNSVGTLCSESEMESNPEVPASNRDEALFWQGPASAGPGFSKGRQSRRPIDLFIEDIKSNRMRIAQ